MDQHHHQSSYQHINLNLDQNIRLPSPPRPHHHKGTLLLSSPTSTSTLQLREDTPAGSSRYPVEVRGSWAEADLESRPSPSAPESREHLRAISTMATDNNGNNSNRDLTTTTSYDNDDYDTGSGGLNARSSSNLSPPAIPQPTQPTQLQQPTQRPQRQRQQRPRARFHIPPYGSGSRTKDKVSSSSSSSMFISSPERAEGGQTPQPQPQPQPHSQLSPQLTPISTPPITTSRATPVSPHRFGQPTHLTPANTRRISLSPTSTSNGRLGNDNGHTGAGIKMNGHGNTNGIGMNGNGNTNGNTNGNERGRTSNVHALTDLLDPEPYPIANAGAEGSGSGSGSGSRGMTPQLNLDSNSNSNLNIKSKKSDLAMMMDVVDLEADTDEVVVAGPSKGLEVSEVVGGKNGNGNGRVRWGEDADTPGEAVAGQEGEGDVDGQEGQEGEESDDDEEEDEEDDDEEEDGDADEEEQVDGDIAGHAEEDDEGEGENDDDDDEEDEEEDEEEDDDDEEDDDKSVDLSDDEPVFLSSRKPLTVNQLLSGTDERANGSGEAGSVRVKQESQEEAAARTGQGQDDRDPDAQMVILDLPPLGSVGTPNETGLDLPRSGTVEAMQVDEQATVATQGSLLGAASVQDSTLTDLPDSVPASLNTQIVQTTTTEMTAAVAKPKKKRAVLTTSAVAPPEPAAPLPMQTVRLEFDLNNPASFPKPTGKEKPGRALIINFKQEAIDRGVVEKGYWEGLWGLGLAAEGEGEGSDGDVDMEEKTDKKKQGKKNGLSGQVPEPKAGPGPSSSLAALMAAVGDAPGDSAEAERLAAEYHKQYEESAPVKKTIRTRKSREAEYDVSDPFVDDSELMVDEPMFYQEPKRAGFHVALGDIELCGVVEDEPIVKCRKKRVEGEETGGPVKKRKTKTILGMGIRPGMLNAEIRKNSLNNIVDGMPGSPDVVAVESRQESPEIQVLENTKKDTPAEAWVPRIYAGPEEALATMPEAIHAELRELWRQDTPYRETNFYKSKEGKKIFPHDLVAPSKAVGRKAIDLRIVDDPFFDAVAPYHIGYNRFTMKKWLLNNCKDYLSVSIANLEEKILAELQIEIDVLAVDYMQAFEEEMKKAAGETTMEVDPVTGETTVVPMVLPQRKWRWTARLRELFAAAVENVEYEIHYVTKIAEAMEEKNKEKPKKVIPLPKGQAIRTRLYGRVVELFPEGWMTTGLLSREMSMMKAKKKQVQA